MKRQLSKQESYSCCDKTESWTYITAFGAFRRATFGRADLARAPATSSGTTRRRSRRRAINGGATGVIPWDDLSLRDLEGASLGDRGFRHIRLGQGFVKFSVCFRGRDRSGNLLAEVFLPVDVVNAADENSVVCWLDFTAFDKLRPEKRFN